MPSCRVVLLSPEAILATPSIDCSSATTSYGLLALLFTAVHREKWNTILRMMLSPSMSDVQTCPWLHSDACVFVAWDLETTGSDPLQHEIVQIAAVSNRGSFTSLVRPRRGCVTPGAKGVHGIGDEQLRTAPIFPNALKDFLSFISEQVLQLDSCAEKVHLIIVGHNSWVFDEVFLTAEIVRSGEGRGGNLYSMTWN